MPLSIEEKKSIIAYRVQKADSVFIEASDNATMNHWNLVANRLYYAVFHMASALLIDKGFTSKTHSGVICLLGQEFATKGLLDKDEMRLVSRLQNMRHAGDYDDMFCKRETKRISSLSNPFSCKFLPQQTNYTAMGLRCKTFIYQ
jgi:uncharacterized protein (UPF0332 family)